jgi:HEAT repeat protein
MVRETGPLPLDARLLSQTVIELNIARRTVALYPQGHPAVERSLARAHEFLTRLFETRPEITLAVAKDALVVDDAALDRRNPVYREFALCLNRLGIVALSFRIGLSLQELHGFCRALVAGASLPAGPEFGRLLEKEGVSHLGLGYIDYADFESLEGKTQAGDSGPNIWERYVHGLLEQALGSGEAVPELWDLPPRTLARFFNERPPENLKEESYDRIITAYLRRSEERLFSNKELAKLLDFVEALKPTLKRQFLSSTIKLLCSDLEAAELALRGMEAERVIAMLASINEQQLLIPEAFRTLLVTLSKITAELPEDRSYAGRVLADDHVIAPDVTELLGSGSFSHFVTDSYQEELRRLRQFDAAGAVSEKAADIRRECAEERIEQDFAALLGELICSDVIPEQDYRSFVEMMVQEAEGHLATGRYEEVVRSIDLLELNRSQGRHPTATGAGLERFHAPEFLRKTVDSLAILGRLRREEARSLCGRFGKELLPDLVDALVTESSQAVRRYLTGLIAGLGQSATNEVIRRLDEPRWFVQRNMIFLLGECDPTGALPQVGPLCRSANAKVSFEAIRYTLRAGDTAGIEPLLDHLRGQDRANAARAIGLAGALRVREAVPSLLQMLARKTVSGADLLGRVPIVKALGDIADERALPALRELVGARSLLFRGALERVRDEVFLSLKRFPRDAVRDLLEEGARSHSERVRTECLRLLEAHHG